MKERTVDKHLHGARSRVLGERPVHPLAFVLRLARGLVNSVVPAIKTRVPIHAAVAPWRMHVEFTLVEGIESFKQCGVGRKNGLVASDPTLECHCGVYVKQGRRIQLHAVVPVHVHPLGCAGRPGVTCLTQAVAPHVPEPLQRTPGGAFHPFQDQVQHEVARLRTHPRLVEVQVPFAHEIGHRCRPIDKGGPP